ncbi:hypothetical protein PSSM7_106 [Prochlorococcus phage P-SSM7]|uniref:Uncharacterized protein n=1 Tax=Prochlorococcus phage P-SSM7 TaxID=445688 RepID=E3SNM4_9CAUD|nr:hypothetical protein PSSM7_106 [Prochlorococcus phage P-SSM7]ADO98997.1 hypothetical protein PSSM7_106 [Prochlorococcus phage P-SSM7]
MDNMKATINERGDYWHPDPEKDKKLGGPGANQRAREDRADAAKPKSDPKKLRKGESYMDYAKRHGHKKSTPKKKSLLGRLGLRKEAYRVLAKDKGEEGKPSQFSYKDEKDAKKFADGIKSKGGKATVTKEHHQKDKDGKVIEHDDTTPSSVEEEIKMTRKAYSKIHKDFRSDMKNPRTTKYVPGKGTVSMPVKFVEEGKGYQPEIEHSKMGDAKKKAEKKRKEAEKSLPPHLKLDTMRKAFAHTNESIDLTEEWVDASIEVSADYFFAEGINEDGLDQIIDEVGLEDFVDFVIDPIEELNEERAARKASAKAPSYAKVKAKVDAGDAARKKAGKGEYADTAAAKRNYGDEEAPEGKTAKKKAVAKVTVRKPKAAPKKKAATVKKVEKAVKTAKKTQPTKPTSKKGLLGRVGDAVKKGVERHNKARAAGKVPEKRVKEFTKGFKKGVSGTVKFAGKVKKAVTNEERVEEALKQARKNVGASKCWDGYKAKGTKKKGGKEVPNCVKEEEIDEMNTELSSIKQKYKGKMTKSSVVKRIKGDDESKREFRNSYKKDIEGGYVGTHKPTKSNLKSALKKQNEEVVDEGIGDMAIKAIEKTNPPYISKRSDMMRKIKLKQLKSYLKKQDDKKKSASKD